MRLLIETISEFTYFQNILLGLAKSLARRRGVKRTTLKKIPSVSYAEITNWEHKHGVLLPDEFRAFYLSGNGFNFEWTYTFAETSGKEEPDPDVMVICDIKINELEHLSLVYGYQTTSEPKVTFDGQRYQMRLSLDSKIFELVSIPDEGQVVLVYLYPKCVPTIWLLTSDSSFYFLADDLATYFRMAIAHLGIANWQLAYTSEGVPSWTESMFRMLVPDLLKIKTPVERMGHERHEKNDEEYTKVPVNRLDPNLLKLLSRPLLPMLLFNHVPAPEPTKPKPTKKRTPVPKKIKSQKQFKKPNNSSKKQ